MNLQLPPSNSLSAPQTGPAPAVKRRAVRMPLAARMGILIGFMALLALVAGAGGLWIHDTTSKQIELMQVSKDLTSQFGEIQTNWIFLVDVLDKAVISSPAAEDFENLNSRLNALNQSLDRLATSIDNAATVASNQESRQTLLNLRSIYARTDSLAIEVFEQASEGRFYDALKSRNTELPLLQSSLLQELEQLHQYLDNEIAARSAVTARSTATARILSSVTIVLAVLLATNVFRIGRKVIIHPLAALKDQVDRVAMGNFSGSGQTARNDEIGELSQAVDRMAETVHKAQAEMDLRIQERSEALERRTTQVQVAAQTARDIASSRSLDQLLENAVEMIRDRFGFYHAGLFLTDAHGEYQSLRAATGEAGRAMLARAHSLKIGETSDKEPTGLVGSAAFLGEPQVSSDVSQDQSHFKNPLLPETRSEAALPLKAGGRVIGVLDVQSRQPDAFDPESLSILQVMADQLAIAIQNANLLNEVQRNLEDMQQAYGELERKAWLRFFQGAPKLGYIYDGKDIHPVSTLEQTPADKSTSATAPFVQSLRVRGQEIGLLEVWPRQGELSSEETTLLTTLNTRLSQILESARLYEETQARAAREELINQLTTQIASATDLDGVLRAAAVELAGIPAVREATVALVSPEIIPAGGKHKDHDNFNGGGNGHRS